MYKFQVNHTHLYVKKGDITNEKVDVIVNAANTSLLGGGGVDGAIHRVGGSQVREDCEKIRLRQGRCRVGEAVMTRAGNLQAKYVIHTVGPVWNGGRKNEEELLRTAYGNTLELAKKYKVTSISFPAIGTGTYRFPLELAAKIAISSVLDFISKEEECLIQEVHFVLFDEINYQTYIKQLSAIC